MYSLLELSMADTARLYSYKLDDIFGASFSLKGFEYPWIVAAREWKPGERVLDVGAAYSPLPLHIADTFDCEVWSVDDFGRDSDQPFWTRHQDPEEYVREHPEVHFVFERLGDPTASSLEEGSFDVVYSASTLEHVPDDYFKQVWQHMDQLIKPGGEMLHAIDLKYQADRGLRYLLQAVLFDALAPALPSAIRQPYVRATPIEYVRQVAGRIGIEHLKIPRSLRQLNMLLNPETLVESPSIVFNRIVKDDSANIRYQRRAALLIHLRKF